MVRGERGGEVGGWRGSLAKNIAVIQSVSVNQDSSYSLKVLLYLIIEIYSRMLSKE